MLAASEDNVLRPAQPRLAEMVMHLSGCRPEQAVHTVDAAVHKTPAESGVDDPLLIVARALVALRRVDLREPVDIREQLTRAEPTKRVGG